MQSAIENDGPLWTRNAASVDRVFVFLKKFVLGQIFFLLVFRFLAYLLSCILFLFALRYFVNYAPLLRTVCKFRYSLLSRPYLLPVLRIYQCNNIRQSRLFFPRWPWPPTLSSSAFGKQLRFHRFSLISFCNRFKVVFLYCNYYFISLCRNLLLWFGNSKNICWSGVHVLCFGIGPCPFSLCFCKRLCLFIKNLRERPTSVTYFKRPLAGTPWVATYTPAGQVHWCPLTGHN